MSVHELEDNTDPKTKRYILRRSIMDIGMGVIYISIAFVIFISNRIGLINEFANSIWGKFLQHYLHYMVYGGCTGVLKKII